MTYDDWKTTEPSEPCLGGCGRDTLHCLCDEICREQDAEAEFDNGADECAERFEYDGDDSDRGWDHYQTWGLACAMVLCCISAAHAAVAPTPEKASIVCRVLDGTYHEREWLTHEDALQRVDVIRIVLGVDVLIDCRPSRIMNHTQWALVVPAFTHHFPVDRGMNDRNWGAAVEYQIRSGLWALAEDYDNSVRRNTFVVGAAYLPIRWHAVSLGGAMGLDLTHGYKNNPAAPLIADLRAIVRVNRRVSVGLDVVPGHEIGVATSIRYTLQSRVDSRR